MAARIRRHFALTLGAFLLTLVLCSPASSQKMQLHFIDVGQGAATLVEFPCAAILIDTGGESGGGFDSTTELVKYLDDFFNRRSDLNGTLHSLILSHPHIDHTRGVQEVLRRYKILNAITNGLERGSGAAGQIALHRDIAAQEGTQNPIGFVEASVKDIPENQGLTNNIIDPVKCPAIDPKITLLWGAVENNIGWTQGDFDNLNNHSAIVRIDFGNSSFLYQGDLEEAAIPDFITHYKNSNLLAADVYQVGHHGSANGTTDDLLQSISPKFAVMAMGPDTRQTTFSAWGFGHPRKVTVDRLERFVATSRDPVTFDVATGQHQFQPQAIDKAIYGTGWESTIVLEGDATGSWRNPKQSVTATLTGRLNLNTATLSQLITLPAIGAARARAILDYRQQHGPFSSVDDLRAVNGIGPATMVGIRDRVTVGN